MVKIKVSILIELIWTKAVVAPGEQVVSFGHWVWIQWPEVVVVSFGFANTWKNWITRLIGLGVFEVTILAETCILWRPLDVLVQRLDTSRYVLHQLRRCQQLLRGLLLWRSLHDLTLHPWNWRLIILDWAHSGKRAKSFDSVYGLLCLPEPAKMTAKSTLLVFVRYCSQGTTDLQLALYHDRLKWLQLFSILLRIPLLRLLSLDKGGCVSALNGAVEVVLAEIVLISVDWAVKRTTISEVCVSLHCNLVVQGCCQSFYLLLILELLSHHAVTTQLLHGFSCMIHSFESDFLAHHWAQFHGFAFIFQIKKFSFIFILWQRSTIFLCINEFSICETKLASILWSQQCAGIITASTFQYICCPWHILCPFSTMCDIPPVLLFLRHFRFDWQNCFFILLMQQIMCIKGIHSFFNYGSMYFRSHFLLVLVEIVYAPQEDICSLWLTNIVALFDILVHKPIAEVFHPGLDKLSSSLSSIL